MALSKPKLKTQMLYLSME